VVTIGARSCLIVGVKSGNFDGPNLKGTVLPGGGVTRTIYLINDGVKQQHLSAIPRRNSVICIVGYAAPIYCRK
jgi:hypothetical protein